MIPLVRCRVCGFITTEKKLKDKCAACGAPRSAFIPYTDAVSERRRRILDLNLHPMVVHFPQAFATFIFALSITPFIFKGYLQDLFVSSTKVLSLILPLAVAASFLAGYLDGKIRFKKVQRSPILKKKISLAAILVIASLALAFLTWLGDLSLPGTQAAVIGLALVTFVSSLVLGVLGQKILGSAMPGD